MLNIVYFCIFIQNMILYTEYDIYADIYIWRNHMLDKFSYFWKKLVWIPSRPQEIYYIFYLQKV